MRKKKIAKDSQAFRNRERLAQHHLVGKLSLYSSSTLDGVRLGRVALRSRDLVCLGLMLRMNARGEVGELAHHMLE